MSEVEVDLEDRPVYPPKITHVEIVDNPFDDIVPRQLPKRPQELKKDKNEAKLPKRSKKLDMKNTSLLSFAEEEDQNEVTQIGKGKGKSLHDMVSDDPRILKESIQSPLNDKTIKHSLDSKNEKETFETVVPNEPEVYV